MKIHPANISHLQFYLIWLLLGLVFPLAVASVDADVTIKQLLDGPVPQTMVYKTVGGNDLRLYYFTPADHGTRGGRPAIVWIHGGGWTGGTLEALMPHARYMAARGAVGINVEYRLLKPAGPSLADCIADCKSAVRFIRTHATELGIDPRRIAVAGESAGGHLAAAVATLDGFDEAGEDTKVSARPDALILLNPVLDLTEGNWIRSALGGSALADRTSPLPDSPESIAFARSLSPIFHAKPGVPPTLLMHVREDVVVPWTQAQRFADALKEAGNRCDLLLLEKKGHAFGIAFWRSPEPVVVETIRTIDGFLASLGYLTGEPTLVVSPSPAWIPRGPGK